ncbi:hypothetical protein TARUN_2390 [Trichoderma arundinaceum]|uniref:Uncharacterized protein n=1 Tax=Trichoderma arundinaceum TaxID=490622 RepID=A0A395NUP0_TRIAR|nr:hypothetical protein TARUN_2390 [Trichoderma arundinaceum]
MRVDDDGVERGGPDNRPLSEMTRDELLWTFRTNYEGGHRARIRYGATMHSYQPSVRDADANRLPDVSYYNAWDYFNKSVPVYIVPGFKWLLLRVVLHNYIYRRWFRPYRSEIDYERFICGFIVPQDLPEEMIISQSTIQSIISLNQALCTTLDSQRSRYIEEYQSYVDHPEDWLSPPSRHPDHYILQPLFRAIAIVVSDEHYNNEPSKLVGDMFVYLALTGVEDGLSAPISFEPIAAKINKHIEPGRVIQVTLETAIDFIMHLEAREAAVFGLRPEPIVEWESDRFISEVWQSIGETEPLVGPSSQWVDDLKYPHWSGNGEHSDSQLMVRVEAIEFRFQSRRAATREAFLEEARRTGDESSPH